MAEPTLYDRLGGVYAIAAVIDRFSDELVKRETIHRNTFINTWNKEESKTRIAGLKFLRTLWVCDVAGGPFDYTAKPLDEAHSKFHITPEDFDEVAAVLAESLDYFGVPEKEKQEVLGAFAAHKGEVTAGAAVR